MMNLNYVSAIAAMTPQQHSHDFRVRMSAAALRELSFEHLETVADPSVLADYERGPGKPQALEAGFTEWQCRAGRVVLSLGWDWVLLQDGSMQMLHAVGPRSNIQLVDAQGYDLDQRANDQALWDAIESRPWKAEVALAARHSPGASGTAQ